MKAPTDHHAGAHLQLDVDRLRTVALHEKDVPGLSRGHLENDLLDLVAAFEQLRDEVPGSILREWLAITAARIGD